MTVEGETPTYRTRTFAELKRDVAVFAAALRKAGVKKNDRVVGGYDYEILKYYSHRTSIFWERSMIHTCDES